MSTLAEVILVVILLALGGALGAVIADRIRTF